MGNLIDEICTGIPEWRKHAIKVYYMNRDGHEESAILCPDHRMEFYNHCDDATGNEEKFPLDACEICNGTAKFKTIIVRNEGEDFL